jgi:hypothetical protein
MNVVDETIDVDEELRRGALNFGKTLQRAIYHRATHPEEFPPRLNIITKKINPKYDHGGSRSMLLSSLAWVDDAVVESSPDEWEYRFDGKTLSVEDDGKEAVDALVREHQESFDKWAQTYWPDGVPEKYQRYRDVVYNE